VTSRGAGWALAALIFVVRIPAVHAHEVLHTIERGKAIAVKAFFGDGEVLAYTEYQIFSPTDPRIPYQKGRTDRSGYVAFVPDAPGAWRVKVTDTTGHGLDLLVDVAAPGATGPKSGRLAGQGGEVASWAFAVRPILGVAVIVALFALLVLLQRRKRSTK
jgi:nickel transport protein